MSPTNSVEDCHPVDGALLDVLLAYSTPAMELRVTLEESLLSRVGAFGVLGLTGLVITERLKLMGAEVPAAFVAVAVKLTGPAVVGVPESTPLLLMESQLGCPCSAQLVAPPDAVRVKL